MPNILLIEDDPPVRKAVRRTLESEGYIVFEVPDGNTALELLRRQSVDVIVQDFEPPDMDGLDLVRQLRGTPGVTETPVLGYGAPLSPEEQARGLETGVTAFVTKPVDPALLLEKVRECLSRAHLGEGDAGRRQRIVAANDNPMLLKLTKLKLEEAGFEVVTAEDGEQALEMARQSPPDAILSDVLMPKMDGFRLCAAVRRDPQLAQTPVVLVSASYTEEADWQLARNVGASAMSLATPDCRDAIRALLGALSAGPASLPVAPPVLTEEYTHRVVRQLEKQTASNVALAHRLATREVELGILAGMGEAFRKAAALEEILDGLLCRCLDVAEFSAGAVFLAEADGSLALRAQLGFAGAPGSRAAGLPLCTGLLRRVFETGEPLAAPSGRAPEAEARELLERSGAQSLLILPLTAGEERLGVLVMAAASFGVGETWLPFSKALGNQVGQAIALARALGLVREKEEFLERIVETLAEGVLIFDRQERITFVNPTTEKIFDLPREALLGKTLEETGIRTSTPEGDPVPGGRQPSRRAMETGQPVYDVEHAVERLRGDRVLVSRSSAPLRDASGNVVGAVTSVSDITERKRAEALAREKQELARSNAELEQFAYTAAHDLKEPLRTVTSFAKLLAQRYKGQCDEKAGQFVGHMLDGAERMQQLIDGLLSYSQVSSKGRSPAPVNCETLFQNAVANLHTAIEATGAEVLHDPLPTVTADAIEIGQLFQNVIGNALKFHGGKPPRVEVSARQEGVEWIFSVRDHGIGIDPKHAQRIFEVFERLHGKNEYPGSGIGLATCKKIVERHGGRMWVESESDQGATFLFTIPVAQA